jgi:general secretion pathway protein K
VALITAVLVVALASIAAAAMLSSANLAIHRATTLSDTERAWWYADGIETWVKSILTLDLQNSKNVDSLGEPWAKPVDYLPVDEGALRGGIIDLQGRFNLNNLSVGNNDPNNPQFVKYKRIFVRMLANIEALQGVPTDGIAEAIHDWTDGDDVPMGFGGAEDSEYSTMEPLPYRAPNRLMSSVSELLAVKGVTKQIYLAIRDNVCVLPRTNTKINVNTATPALLMALGDQPGTGLAQFLESRVDKPAEDVNRFWSDNFPGQPPVDYLSVNTEYFLLHGEAFIGSSHLALYSVIYRPHQPGSVPAIISRSQDID